MALTFAGLTSGQNGSGGTSIATASVSPSTDALVFVGFAAGRASPFAAGDITLSGLSGTWPRLGFISRVAATQLAEYDLWLFASSDATGSGTITATVTGGAAYLFAWSVVEATGDVQPSVVGTAVTGTESSNLSLTLTLPAFANASNRAFAVFAQTGLNTGTTPGSGVTEIHDVSTYFGDGQLQTAAGATNDNTIDASTAFNDAWEGIAVELTDASTAAALVDDTRAVARGVLRGSQRRMAV